MAGNSSVPTATADPERVEGDADARFTLLETIREFVSGAAVTLLLDLPFLVIFLAIVFLALYYRRSALRER